MLRAHLRFHPLRLDLVALRHRHLRGVDLHHAVAGVALPERRDLVGLEGIGGDGAAQVRGIGIERRCGEHADRLVSPRRVAAEGRVKHVVRHVHRPRQMRGAAGRQGEDAVVGLVLRGDVGPQREAQHRERARRFLAQPAAGGAQRVGDQRGVEEERVGAIGGAGVAGVAQVVQADERLRHHRAVDRVHPHEVVVVDRLAAGQGGLGAVHEDAVVVDLAAGQACDQAVDAAEVQQQHAADGAVDDAEAARIGAAQVVGDDRHRPECEGRQRASCGLVHPVVVQAQRRLAAGGGGELVRQRAAEAHIDAAAQAGAAALFVVGGDGAVGGDHVAADVHVVAPADEDAAGRVDRVDAVVLDVVLADGSAVHDGERDAAAPHLLRLREHLLGEGRAQVVHEAVAADLQVAHRMRGAQQRRKRQRAERGVDHGDQVRFRIVRAQHGARRGGQRGIGPQREADARQPHLLDEIPFDRDLVQKGLRLADAGRRARRHGDRIAQHALVPRLLDADDAPARRHRQQRAARCGLDARHAVVVGAVAEGGARRHAQLAGGVGGELRVRGFEIHVDTGLRHALLVLHEGEELARVVDVDGNRRIIGRGREGTRQRRARLQRGRRHAQQDRRRRGRWIEVAAEHDAVARTADDMVLQQPHPLAARAQMDAAERPVRRLRQQQRSQAQAPHIAQVKQHQLREAVQDDRPRAGVGRVAGRVVVRLAGIVRPFEEGDQHECVALDQAVVRRQRDRGEAGHGVQQVQPVVVDVQLRRLVRADAVHARHHAQMVQLDLLAAAFLAADEQDADAVVGCHVQVAHPDAGAVGELHQRVRGRLLARQHQRATAAAVDGHVDAAVQLQVRAVDAGQQAQLAAGLRQLCGGLFQRVEVAEARHAVADQEAAAELLVGERTEALAAVLDGAADVGVQPGGPVDLGQRHAVVDDAGGRRVVHQHVRVADLAGAQREGPVVAGPVVPGRLRVEHEADAVAQFHRAQRVGEGADFLEPVPEAEEDGIGRCRQRPEHGGCGERERVVRAERGVAAVDHAPLPGEFVVMQCLQVEAREAAVEDGG